MKNRFIPGVRSPPKNEIISVKLICVKNGKKDIFCTNMKDPEIFDPFSYFDKNTIVNVDEKRTIPAILPSPVIQKIDEKIPAVETSPVIQKIDEKIPTVETSATISAVKTNTLTSIETSPTISAVKTNVLTTIETSPTISTVKIIEKKDENLRAGTETSKILMQPIPVKKEFKIDFTDDIKRLAFLSSSVIDSDALKNLLKPENKSNSIDIKK